MRSQQQVKPPSRAKQPTEFFNWTETPPKIFWCALTDEQADQRDKELAEQEEALKKETMRKTLIEEKEQYGSRKFRKSRSHNMEADAKKRYEPKDQDDDRERDRDRDRDRDKERERERDRDHRPIQRYGRNIAPMIKSFYPRNAFLRNPPIMRIPYGRRDFRGGRAPRPEYIPRRPIYHRESDQDSDKERHRRGRKNRQKRGDRNRSRSRSNRSSRGSDRDKSPEEQKKKTSKSRFQ